MQKSYEKLNDHTVSVVIDYGRVEDAKLELRRVFDFRTQQVTTIYSVWVGASVTTVTNVQNFRDLGPEEIEEMRKKLHELGGVQPNMHGRPPKPSGP